MKMGLNTFQTGADATKIRSWPTVGMHFLIRIFSFYFLQTPPLALLLYFKHFGVSQHFQRQAGHFSWDLISGAPEPF